MKLICLIGLFLFSYLHAGAQHDTTHLPGQHSEIPIFSTNDTVTRNDYLLSIDRGNCAGGAGIGGASVHGIAI